MIIFFYDNYLIYIKYFQQTNQIILLNFYLSIYLSDKLNYFQLYNLIGLFKILVLKLIINKKKIIIIN